MAALRRVRTHREEAVLLAERAAPRRAGTGQPLQHQGSGHQAWQRPFRVRLHRRRRAQGAHLRRL